ncbi:MAG: sensor histidine kinase, partial [Gallionellaceae bacterium]|nr:sensor histidine kinase [Gallionellaceae bacterium]
MHPSVLATQTSHSHLRRLVLLRVIAVAGQCTMLWLAYRFNMQLAWLPMLATVAALAGLTLLTWWRLHTDRPVSNFELFAQLCADVLALSVLLYYAGGSTNPFISLFLLPLVIAAATLPHGYTWAMTGITTGCYTLLMKFYVPLPTGSEHDGAHDGAHHVMPPDDAFNMHVIGMWLGFVISAVVVAYFVVKMAHAVRTRDETIARVREETLRNERIVALGTQAAGAAHEMGTPLSTLSVIIGELKRDNAVLPEWRDSLTTLDEQVRACKRILDKLLVNAQDADTRTSEPLDKFLATTLDEWQLLRPAVQCNYQASGAQPAPHMRADPALRAALLNLLNNAADASPEGIDVHARWDEKGATLEIHDHGQGLTSEAAAR